MFLQKSTGREFLLYFLLEILEVEGIWYGDYESKKGLKIFKNRLFEADNISKINLKQ